MSPKNKCFLPIIPPTKRVMYASFPQNKRVMLHVLLYPCSTCWSRLKKQTNWAQACWFNLFGENQCNKYVFLSWKINFWIRFYYMEKSIQFKKIDVHKSLYQHFLWCQRNNLKQNQRWFHGWLAERGVPLQRFNWGRIPMRHFWFVRASKWLGGGWKEAVPTWQPQLLDRKM